MSKQRLRMKKIDRVALVDKGDNPLANVLIHKRAPEVVKSDALTFNQAYGARKVSEDLWQYTGALESAIRNALESDEENRGALIAQSLDQFAAAMKDAYPAWLGGIEAKEPTVEKTEKVGLLKMFAKALGLEESTVPEPKKEEPPVSKETETPAPVAVDKAAIEALQKRAEDAEKVAKENADRVSKLEEEREVSQFVTKAAAIKGVPGLTADDFGPIYRKIAKALTAEEFAKVEQILKGAGAAITQGALLQEFGTDSPSEGSALAKVEARAAEIRKADPKLSPAQAEAQVYKENPELRREVTREERAARAARTR